MFLVEQIQHKVISRNNRRIAIGTLQFAIWVSRPSDDSFYLTIAGCGLVLIMISVN